MFKEKLGFKELKNMNEMFVHVEPYINYVVKLLQIKQLSQRR
jgi:hypothetical protein